MSLSGRSMPRTAQRNALSRGGLGLVLWLGVGRGAAAQELALPAGAGPGQVTERVIALSDTAESYALYLPSGYRADRSWPVLYLLDPGGRALVPLHLVQPAADRYGYVVLSSYDTRSDTSTAPNERALTAMFRDTERRYAADTRRLYLMGFSGTARQSWLFAYQYRDNVAGVIGLGAGLPSPTFLTLTRDSSVKFGFFGGAGTTDFNYDEVRALDRALDHWDFPHRVRWYEGPHRWPPEEVFTAAIEWMELNAMRRNLEPKDVTLIDALYRKQMAQADHLEQGGATLEAYERYRGTADDFEGLHEVASAVAARDRLAATQPVRQAEAMLDRAQQRYAEYLERLDGFKREMASASALPTPGRAQERLLIPQLRREAAGRDSIEARAVQRLLESAFVRVAFYYPEDDLAQGHPDRALLMLGVALAIKPEDPGACYQRARALAQLHREAEAIEALACAARGGNLTAARLESDQYLAPLKGTSAFQDFLHRLPARPEGERGTVGVVRGFPARSAGGEEVPFGVLRPGSAAAPAGRALRS